MTRFLALLALAAAQDGAVDMPPPRPIPADLAAPFAGAIRRNQAFAAATGRTVESATQGFVMPRSTYPAWVVEFHWREKGALRPGVAFLVDVPAARKLTSSGRSIPDASLEGPWAAIAVFEDQTLAMWSEDLERQRRANNESMTASDVRMIISSEEGFRSTSGSYGDLRCLSLPASCLPRPKDPLLPLDVAYTQAERNGYRRTFHPGAPVQGKENETGLIATWAYTAVPMDPKFGRRAFCGDSARGDVCAVEGATMPPLVGGACPKSCLPLR